MNDWYIIQHIETPYIFIKRDGGMTFMLPDAFMGPYGVTELFYNMHLDEDTKKLFTIKKIKIV